MESPFLEFWLRPTANSDKKPIEWESSHGNSQSEVASSRAPQLPKQRVRTM